MSRMQNKVVVITGAAQGIGAAIAGKFAEEGAVLALLDVDTERLRLTASRVGQRAPAPMTIAADVTEETPVEDARNQFSAMLDRALEGQCQVIGKRRRALLISVEEIATMLQEASMPPTWGQAFDPTEELPGIAETLWISEDRAPRPEFLARELQASLIENAQQTAHYQPQGSTR